MSENQKRKQEEKKKKQEAAELARKQEEERLRLEKIKKKKEQEDREMEERRRKTEEMFRGMALANEMKQQQNTGAAATSFESIMNEQANSSAQQRAQEQKVKQIREAQSTGMKFDYIGMGQKAVAKDTAAAAA